MRIYEFCRKVRLQPDSTYKTRRPALLPGKNLLQQCALSVEAVTHSGILIWSPSGRTGWLGRCRPFGALVACAASFSLGLRLRLHTATAARLSSGHDDACLRPEK